MAHVGRNGTSKSSQPEGLSPSQLEIFNRDGYLIVPDFLPSETTSLLLAETRSLLSDFSLESHPLTTFSTGEGDKSHIGDAYFLESGDKIHFFFEEDAFNSKGELLKPKERAINKIGHYLHALSSPFNQATITLRNAAIVRDLGYKDPRVHQSMVICKQPEIGGRVAPHQDSTFIYTDPPSAVGFWIALEDATAENGCLSFAKGSHRRNPVRSRLVRTHGGTGFEDVTGAKFPRGFQSEPHLDTEEDYQLEEVKAGALVLIHGNLLHKSEKNLSSKGRTVYTFHIIDGQYEYDQKNWLQPTAGGFTKL